MGNGRLPVSRLEHVGHTGQGLRRARLWAARGDWTIRAEGVSGASTLVEPASTRRARREGAPQTADKGIDRQSSRRERAGVREQRWWWREEAGRLVRSSGARADSTGRKFKKESGCCDGRLRQGGRGDDGKAGDSVCSRRKRLWLRNWGENVRLKERVEEGSMAATRDEEHRV